MTRTVRHEMTALLLTLSVSACGDASEALADQIGTQAAELRASPSTSLTFVYQPKGCRGDFSVEVFRGNMIGNWTRTGALIVECQGGGGGGTTHHLQFVEVPVPLPRHRYKNGDSITITLTKDAGGTIQFVSVQ